MASPALVIDTSIFIEYLLAKDKRATTLYKIPNTSVLYLSAITLYELLMGATNEQKWNDVLLLTEDLIILPFSDEVAESAANIYHQLRRENKIIEFRDIFIAATCIIHKLTIKTSNKKDYKRINGLTVE